MGKSIRSKVKRANRSILRKDFSEPIINKKQMALAKKMANDKVEREGTSILGLKAALGGEKEEVIEPVGEDEEQEEIVNKDNNPYMVIKPDQAMNPFGHMSHKAKAGAPMVVMAERLREKAIKKALAEGKPVKTKKAKPLTWFK